MTKNLTLEKLHALILSKEKAQASREKLLKRSIDSLWDVVGLSIKDTAQRFKEIERIKAGGKNETE
jgi:hypothetical protein